MIKRGLILTLSALLGMAGVTAQNTNRIVVDNDIELIDLGDSVYIHVTWHQTDNSGRFPSNGLIVIKNGQALMVDTPMDNDKTERLAKYIEDSLSAHLTKLIIGHFHDDCLGGLEYLQSNGIESIANSRTLEKCTEMELPVPSTSFTDILTVNFNGEPIVCRYFGAGHTIDNITVWMPEKKILFGGCLVKSGNSNGLGNLSDAVVSDWDLTIRKILNEYKDIKTVIPGHGEFGGPDLLSHTVELVDREKKR